MRRFIAGTATAVALIITVAGCGGATTAPTASPTAVATATPAPTPTPTVAPTPSPTPSPSAAVDPSEGLKIAAPYELHKLDAVTDAAYQAAMSKALGSFGSALQVGAKQVTKGGLPSGLVLVILFTDTSLSSTPGFLDAVANGSAASTGGAMKKATIEGQPVRYAAGLQSAFAAYKWNDAIVYVVLPTEKDVLAVVTAIIKANK